MNLVKTVLFLFLAQAATCAIDACGKEWTYDGQFHKVIVAADRIAIRDGGFNCCHPVDDQKVMFEVTDPREIREVYDHIKFESPQVPGGCMCCGYPGLDWYKRGQRLALTSVQHGVALRWKGFPGDAKLTPDSSEWIVAWLTKHGVPGLKEQFEAIREQQTVARQARTILRRFVPVGYVDALKRAEAAAESNETSKKQTSDVDAYLDHREKLIDRRVRAAFPNSKAMYTALFQIMGCLPMRWDSKYMPEQYEADDLLLHAPREELDQAFRSAARTKDAAERQGAARVVFSQIYMTTYGKTEHDVAQWMELLADAAYADPFPENRRLVLFRLSDKRDARVLSVLERAVSDPDQTVRRRAIDALVVRGGPEALRILRQVAGDTVRPRNAAGLPADYTKGAGMSFNTEGMDAITYPGTDQSTASDAIRRIR